VSVCVVEQQLLKNQMQQ